MALTPIAFFSSISKYACASQKFGLYTLMFDACDHRETPQSCLDSYQRYGMQNADTAEARGFSEEEFQAFSKISLQFSKEEFQDFSKEFLDPLKQSSVQAQVKWVKQQDHGIRNVTDTSRVRV